MLFWNVADDIFRRKEFAISFSYYRRLAAFYLDAASYFCILHESRNIPAACLTACNLFLFVRFRVLAE
jgi:hypothetical protein